MYCTQLKLSLFCLSILLNLLFCGCTQKEDEIEVSTSRVSITLNKEAMRGRHVFKDGSIYEGELVKGKPNGFGTHNLVNGDIFEGQHTDGFAHGHGTMRYKSESKLDRYVGNWRSGKRYGFGTLILEDSSRLVGDWKNDNLNYGEYQSSNGVIMSGKWNKDYLEEGTMRLEDGAEYSGSFAGEGVFSYGSLLSINGDHYTGRFQNNIYWGKGMLRTADGSIYTGAFLEGEFSGYGILTDNDGSVYSGGFLSGVPNGQGVQTDQSGVVYSGSWSNGEKHGVGTLDFGDGTSYTGKFLLGLAIEGFYDWGEGVLTNSFQDENGNWIDRE